MDAGARRYSIQRPAATVGLHKCSILDAVPSAVAAAGSLKMTSS
jgi:hypothetical protein